jgi:catechol 2,3-dioxygenase-like lactoylglutathione lyase family enzyme
MAVVRYLVHDVDAALKFYGLLGFELQERRSEPFAVTRRGDLELWLSGPGASSTRPLSDGVQPIAGGWNRIVIEVQDLESVVARLEAMGMHVRGDPVVGLGGRHVVVDDPAGNPVELFMPHPKAPAP